MPSDPVPARDRGAGARAPWASWALALLSAVALALPARRATAQPDCDAPVMALIAQIRRATEARDTVGHAAAIVRLQRVAACHQAAGDAPSAANTLGVVATLFSSLARPDSALRYERRALALCDGPRPRTRAADATCAAVEYTSLNGISSAHQELGRLDSAIAATRALITRRARRGMEPWMDTDAWARLGILYRDVGLADSSVAAFRRALDLLGGRDDPLNRFFTASGLAQAYEQLAEPDSARAYHHLALALARRMGDVTGLSVALGNLGTFFHETGVPDSARYYLQRAGPMMTGPLARRARRGWHESMASVLAELGEPDSARAHHDSSLAIARTLNDPGAVAFAQLNLGAFLAETGQPDSALAVERAALASAHAAGRLKVEATLLDNMGGTYRDLGRLDSAFALRRRALGLRQAIRDRDGEATALNNLGLLHDELGRVDSARAYYDRALAIARQTGRRERVATTLANLAGLLEAEHRLDSALVLRRLALAMVVEARARPAEGSHRANLASLLYEMKQPDSALAVLRAALAIRRQTWDRGGEAQVLSNIGGIFRDRANRDPAAADSAARYYREALALARSVRSRNNEAAILGNLGELALRGPPGHRDAAAAAAFLDTGAAVIAGLRRGTGTDADAVRVAERDRFWHTMWARAWLGRATGDTGAAVLAALGAVERGRARALGDLAGGARVADGPETRPGGDLAAEARAALAPLVAERSAALYYAIGRDSLFAWLLAPDGTVRVAVRRAIGVDSTLRLVTWARGTLVVNLRGAGALRGRTARAARIAGPRAVRVAGRRAPGAAARTDPAVDSPRASAALAALAAALLPDDLGARLPAGTPLVVVPQGALAAVPFAALPVPGDTLPLGIRHPLRYTPALRALLAARAAPSHADAVRGDEVLVVGDPTLPDSLAAHFGPLPAAADEARWIALRLGARALTGPAATEAEVRRRLPAARLVHLATHAEADGTEAGARASWVALAGDAADDGRLTMGELLDDRRLALRAELVVLSACESALGELTLGEGTIGLQRALLARGAHTVLVSLWNVHDRPTERLVTRFYAHWLGLDGVPAAGGKAEALRRAQADLRREGGPGAHPSQWAAFQLVGEP